MCQDEINPHHVTLRQDEDLEDVPPTFRCQPDKDSSQYFSLTEHPQNDRKQEHGGATQDKFQLLEKQIANPLRQSEANIFSKPMNPYTVLEAKLDEMKEDEELLFEFKTNEQEDGSNELLLDY